jgi:hypothetical protein
MAKLPPLVTLTTDFGLSDPYVAAMKGVILQLSPMARLVDLTHDLPPHDIMAGAFALVSAVPYFPPETIHVVVVDPGVGTERSILIGKFAGQYFVFPDNGIITFVKEAFSLEGLVVLRNTQILPRMNISSTFHGRDIFAPIAGALASGVPMNEFGPTPPRYKLLDLPVASEEGDQIVGQVLYVDRFGNLITNINEPMVRRRWRNPSAARVMLNQLQAGQVVTTYADVEPGTPLVLFNSLGLLEIAVNQGRACDVFRAGFGDSVVLAEKNLISAKPGK